MSGRLERRGGAPKPSVGSTQSPRAQNPDTVRSAMRAAGFVPADTGGGCKAYRRVVDRGDHRWLEMLRDRISPGNPVGVVVGQEVLVSDWDCGLPVTFDETAHLGVFDQDGGLWDAQTTVRQILDTLGVATPEKVVDVAWVEPITGESDSTWGHVERHDFEFQQWLARQFGAHDEDDQTIVARIVAYAAQHGLTMPVAFNVLWSLWKGGHSISAQPIIRAERIFPGVQIVTPDFVRADDPNVGPVLEVREWDPAEGESLLVDDRGNAYDYNTADYPEELLVVPGQSVDRWDAVASDLAFIDAHRASLGLRPLDPVAAGWGPDDVRIEAARLRRESNPSPDVAELLAWNPRLGA